MGVSTILFQNTIDCFSKYLKNTGRHALIITLAGLGGTLSYASCIEEEIQKPAKQYYVKESTLTVKNTTVIRKNIKWLQNEKDATPAFMIDVYNDSNAPQKHEGTFVYFHGGPQRSASFEGIKDVILSCLNKINYHFVSVEIAGSSEVKEQIEDVGEMPNYVSQTGIIMDYLRADDQYSDKPFVALAHSFGAFQLFNSLRFQGDSCPFSKVISVAGVFNTGSWLFELMVRWNLRNGRHNMDEIVPRNTFMNDLTGLLKMSYHSIEHSRPYYNPVVNQDLNQRLNPFFHTEKLPQIPYLFYVPVNDRNVHPSQTIALHQRLIQQGKVSYLCIDNEAAHNLLSVPSHLPGEEQQEKKRIIAQNRFLEYLETFVQNSGSIREESKFLGFSADEIPALEHKSFYEPNMNQDIYFPDHYHLYRDWNELHQNTEDLAGFFLKNGKHWLAELLQLEQAQDHMKKVAEEVEKGHSMQHIMDANTHNLLFNFLEDLDFLVKGSSEESPKDLKVLPRHWLNKINSIETIYKILPRYSFCLEDAQQSLTKLKKAVGL